MRRAKPPARVDLPLLPGPPALAAAPLHVLRHRARLALVRRRRPTSASCAASRSAATSPRAGRSSRPSSRTKGRFRCAFSISGTALDQMEAHAPEALDVFRELAATGAVEFLAETSHHSLASLSNAAEFRAQVGAHAERVERLFGAPPDDVSQHRARARRPRDAARQGPRLSRRCSARAPIACSGRGAAGRVYGSKAAPGLKLLLRTYRFSDDIAFRFGHGTGRAPADPRAFAALARGASGLRRRSSGCSWTTRRSASTTAGRAASSTSSAACPRRCSRRRASASRRRARSQRP